jgi:Family of unknown function (DUF5317)
VSLVWPLAFGLVLALALGGKPQRLAELRLHGVWLFYVGIAMRIWAFPFHWLPWSSPSFALELSLAAYGVFVLAMLVNVRIPGVAIVGVGLLMNLVTTAVNDEHMPALPSALIAAGKHFTVSRNSAMAIHPHLPWLIDRWAAPDWVPWGNVFSVGDVIVSIGAVVFAVVATRALDRRMRPGWVRRAAVSAS